MSLMDSIKEHYKEASYPPEGPDLDYVKNDEGKWVEGDTETELVSAEETSRARWGTWFTNVYQRGDEFVAVTDCRPATEMQDWGDYGEPEIYVVKPRVETIVKTFYDKVD